MEEIVVVSIFEINWAELFLACVKKIFYRSRKMWQACVCVSPTFFPLCR